MATRKDELVKANLARFFLLVERAREDPAAFCELMGRTPQGDWYEIEGFQREWFGAIESVTRLLLMAPPEFGKSELITRLYVAWYIGKHPERHVGIVRSSQAESEKSVSAISALIQEHPLYRAVFPNIRMARGKLKRDTHSGFKVYAPGDWSRDLTLQGYTWDNLRGDVRLDLLIVDDVLGYENTRTHGQRLKYIEKWDEIYANRVVEGGTIAFLTNAHHPQDLAHELARRPGWTVIRNQAVLDTRSAEGWVSDPKAKPLWERWWPLDRLLKKLAEIGPIAFGRKFLNIAIDEATQRFKPQWIYKCLMNGRGMTFVDKYDGPVLIPMDLGTRENKTSDLTVFMPMTRDEKHRMWILTIEAERLSSPGILDKMVDLKKRFPQAVFYPESNAAQIFIEQFAGKLAGLPVRGFTTTGQNKWDEQFGIESIAVEVYNRQWVYPSGEAWQPSEDLTNLNGLHPEMKALIEEHLLYRPDSHTGDRMMAQWIGREADRLGTAGTISIDMQRR